MDGQRTMKRTGKAGDKAGRPAAAAAEAAAKGMRGASAEAAEPAKTSAAKSAWGDGCDHKNVVQADGEMVCAKCGQVIDDDVLAAQHGLHDNAAVLNSSLPQTWGGPESESNPNLYTRNVLGSANAIPKMKGMQLLALYCKGGLETARDRRHKTRLSKFSNVCEKMRFTSEQAQTAWNLFQRAAKATTPRKAAEAAAWAVYKTCQMYSIPASADEVLGVIKVNFSRKTMPNMIRILYDCMVSTDESMGGSSGSGGGGGKGEAAGTAPAAAMPMAPEPGESGRDYYFALNLRQMLKGRRYSREMYAYAKSDAWHMYSKVLTGNRNMRAKRAIAMAFGVGM